MPSIPSFQTNVFTNPGTEICQNDGFTIIGGVQKHTLPQVPFQGLETKEGRSLATWFMAFTTYIPLWQWLI